MAYILSINISTMIQEIVHCVHCCSSVLVVTCPQQSGPTILEKKLRRIISQYVFINLLLRLFPWH